MRGDRFAYFLNVMHYCIWLHAISYSNFMHKLVFGSIRLLPGICVQGIVRRDFMLIWQCVNSNYMSFKYDKKKGLYIGWAKYKFDYIYSCYPGFLSFVILGLIYKNYGAVNHVIAMTTLLVTIVICYIPAYKAVFADNRYLKYFKEFETKGKKWHKKWKRITIVFCFGGFAIVIFRVAILFDIMIGLENFRFPILGH